MVVLNITLCDESTMFLTRSAACDAAEGFAAAVAASRKNLELRDTDAVTFVVASTGAVVDSDETLRAAVAAVGTDAAALAVDAKVAAAKPLAALSRPLRITREGDIIAEPLNATLAYSAVDASGVLGDARRAVATAAGLAEGATVLLKCILDGEAVPLASDRQLLELLLATDAAAPLTLTFEVAATAFPKRTINVLANRKGALATAEASFEFVFTADSSVPVLDSLKRACFTHLSEEELQSTATAVSVFAFVEGQEVPMNGERVAREVLETFAASAKAGECLHVSMQEGGDEGTRLLVHFDATLRNDDVRPDEAAAFDFRFGVTQDNLLESLKSEARGTFDLLPAEDILLHVESPDGTVALASDNQLRELLQHAIETSVASLPLSVRALRKAPVKVLKVRASREDVPGEVAEFTLRHTIGDDNALTALREAVSEHLDIDDFSSYTLMFLPESEEGFPLTRDKQLDEILLAQYRGTDQPAIMLSAHKDTVKKGSCHMTTVALAVRHGKATEVAFPFRFFPDQPALLEALAQEVRGELELLDGGAIAIAPVEPDGATAGDPFATDDALRVALLAAAAGGGSTDSSAGMSLYVGTAAVPLPRGARFLFATFAVALRGDGVYDDAVVRVRFDKKQEALVPLLVAAVREEFELDGSRPLALAFLRDNGAKEVIASDAAVRICGAPPSPAGPEPVYRLAADLGAPTTVAPPPPSLSREAEVNALVAEWTDVLEGDTFGADDVAQLVATFQREGKQLPPDDPMVVAVADLAASGARKPAPTLGDYVREITAQLSDKDLSHFCHHGRDTVSLLADLSPLSRLRCGINATFRALAVGSQVPRGALERLLRSAQRFAPEDVEPTIAALPAEQCDALSFTDALMHLYSDHPQDIAELLGAAEASRAATVDAAGGSPARRQRERDLDLLRKRRLLQEVRHTMDGVLINGIVDFTVANTETDDAQLLALAHCVAALLQPDQAPVNAAGGAATGEELRGAWAWLAASTATETSAFAFVNTLHRTTRSWAPSPVVTAASTQLLSPFLEHAALLPRHEFLAALSLWATRVAQLTCHAERWPWPPAAAISDSTTASPRGIGAPARVLTPEPPVRPRAAAPRYDFKFSHLCREYETTESRPRSLRELAAEEEQHKTMAQLLAERDALSSTGGDGQPLAIEENSNGSNRQAADEKTTAADPSGGSPPAAATAAEPTKAEGDKKPKEETTPAPPAADKPTGGGEASATAVPTHTSEAPAAETVAKSNTEPQPQRPAIPHETHSKEPTATKEQEPAAAAGTVVEPTAATGTTPPSPPPPANALKNEDGPPSAANATKKEVDPAATAAPTTSEAENETKRKQEEAATKIQALQRGRHARDDVGKLKEEKGKEEKEERAPTGTSETPLPA